ncbi:MAG: hypothetical protein E7336_01630 [Clostridiales bacterium]|nr:hypothetical protein [Clostridiales bacterium]
MGLQFRQAMPIDEKIPMKDAPAAFEYRAEISLPADGWAGMHVGADKAGNGYALLANVKEQCIHFMQNKRDVVYMDKGMKRIPLKADTWYPIMARYDGKILRFWLNENPLDQDPWPKFEFELELKEPCVGLVAGRGHASFRNEMLLPYDAPAPEGEMFTNPVLIGADPDILYHEGRYYIYNRIPNDPNSREDEYLYNGSDRANMDVAGDVNAIFRVSWSDDLVHWSPFTPCLYREKELEGAFCMSPNVFTKDGLFYVLFAGGRFNGSEDFHIYYAVADNPMGPFHMKTTTPIHSHVTEIGGMPFVDEDGQVYITYVRFDRGNNIYLQRLQVKDGLITPEDDTLVHVLSPYEDYEADEYGRIVEGGVIIPHNGYYYMIYADGHYLGHYGESYAVADNVFGPYVRSKYNPILHHHFQADGTGDGIVIYNADRSQIYMGYHRHVSVNDVEPRMTCIDPMKFVPDPEGGPDILTVRGPSTVPQPMPFRK